MFLFLINFYTLNTISYRE